MPQKNVDLANIFQTVTQSLEANKQSLDQADSYNHDHGTNMVQNFQTITNALETKKKSTDSAALAYAAKALAKNTSSSSGQLYAQHLSKAASQFKGKSVDSRGALQLLQTLIGGQGSTAQPGGGSDMIGALLGGMAAGQQGQQPPQSSGNDLLGALLGGLGGQQAPTQQPAPSGGDLMGSLLGGMTGAGPGGSTGQQANGLDLQDLLAAGMAFMQARQQGQSNVQALVSAFMAGSGMGSSSHRNQSTEIVVQSFLQALSSMNSAA